MEKNLYVTDVRRRCGNCAFGHAFGVADARLVECRKEPPRLRDPDNFPLYQFPILRPTDWCGAGLWAFEEHPRD